MPHDPLQKELIQRKIADPNNWLMGQVDPPGLPKMARLPFPNKAGGAIPDGISLGSLFRTLKTAVPDAPPTAQNISSAFDAYRQRIYDLLMKGK